MFHYTRHVKYLFIYLLTCPHQQEGDRLTPVDSVLSTNGDDNSSKSANQALLNQVAETENTGTTPVTTIRPSVDQHASRLHHSSTASATVAPDEIPVSIETDRCQFGLLRTSHFELDNNVHDQPWSSDHYMVGRLKQVSARHRPGVIADIKAKHSSKGSW